MLLCIVSSVQCCFFLLPLFHILSCFFFFVALRFLIVSDSFFPAIASDSFVSPSFDMPISFLLLM